MAVTMTEREAAIRAAREEAKLLRKLPKPTVGPKASSQYVDCFTRMAPKIGRRAAHSSCLSAAMDEPAKYTIIGENGRVVAHARSAEAAHRASRRTNMAGTVSRGRKKASTEMREHVLRVAAVDLMMGKRLEVQGSGKLVIYMGETTHPPVGIRGPVAYWYEHRGGRTYKETPEEVLAVVLRYVGIDAIAKAIRHVDSPNRASGESADLAKQGRVLNVAGKRVEVGWDDGTRSWHDRSEIRPVVAGITRILWGDRVRRLTERNRAGSSMDVANIIAAQMGGTGRLNVMIGARDFSGGGNVLTFRWTARARDGSNNIRITLEPSDTYKVEFYSVRGRSVKLKASFDDIYAEDLIPLFERQTGLYLRM